MYLQFKKMCRGSTRCLSIQSWCSWQTQRVFDAGFILTLTSDLPYEPYECHVYFDKIDVFQLVDALCMIL